MRLGVSVRYDRSQSTGSLLHSSLHTGVLISLGRKDLARKEDG